MTATRSLSIPPSAIRWLALAALAAASLAGLGGCVTRVVERPAAAPAPVVVRENVVVQPAQVRAMPAPVREDRGSAPAPGWNWVPGHWVWQGSNWAWHQGRWVQQVVPPMPAVIVEPVSVPVVPTQFWVPGHWAWRPAQGNWFWVKGAWHG